MRLNRHLAAGVLALSGVVIASPIASNATPVVWEFSGTIAEVDCIRGCAPAGIDVGTPFTGSVTFDTSWPGFDSLQGVRYRGSGQPYGFEAVIGTTHYSHVGRTTYYTVANDYPYLPGGDIYDYLTIDDAPTNHFYIPVIVIRLSDETATLLSSSELVVLPPALTDLTSATFGIGVFPAWDISGPIDQLTMGPPIPEPGTVLLVALGLIALARFSWKGHRADR